MRPNKLRLAVAPQRTWLRSLHSTPGCLSGHSRWATIRHDKAKNDSKKNKQNSVFAGEIATASRLFGSNPANNPRLFDLIAKAKKAGFAKAGIEAAVARGQGKSASGVALEAVTIEAILPGNVGLVVDCETDSRLRTLQQLRTVIKRHGGTIGPATYLFKRRGQVVFEEKDGVGVDEVLETALEAGAVDVEEVDGRVVVDTEPSDVKEVGRRMVEGHALQVASEELTWRAQEDMMTELPSEEIIAELCKMVDDMHDADQSVRGIFMNVKQGKIADGAWSELMSKLDV